MFKNLNPEKELTGVPSRTFVDRVLTEAHHILMNQISDKLAVEDDATLTIDAATQDSVYFLGSQLRFKDGERLVLGEKLCPWLSQS